MIPEEVKKTFEEIGEKDARKIWAGVNQTMRKIHDKSAKIVLIAEDTNPKELVTPLVQEVKTKKIEHYFGTKDEISKLTRCPRPAAAGCLLK
jgi:ribosomal protein L7Ae-like RNA K-turn-binding protein